MNGHPNSRPLLDRLAEKIEFDEHGCWRFQGAKRDGYGLIGIAAGRARNAHRVAYELLVGPIPEGHQIDHLCRVRDCVNPDHLEPVTQRENVRRGISPAAQHHRQTHCKRGHEFTPENTRVETTGARRCLACKKERAA